MVSSRVIYVLVTILLVVTVAATVEAGGYEDTLGFVSSNCRGSIADCISEEEEFGLDSEISRRILASKKYVSYGAMRKNNVPCSRRGASYYNCQRGAQANPYSRGCSTITRCRR
ncbi:Protein RALF-like 22 [Raphanus sativus]|uniref:Protein RALF-like 22 n=1 Tax=Raphanus sativus TaxID=3726 RepID=A0A6J0L6R0_RAPSA|nr:protein RALF-like 22 [Raphanus sativus]KAJ4877672.1 Protein RALF-like 22 [Raphanus sativus]